jgi:hypothetical protein
MPSATSQDAEKEKRRLGMALADLDRQESAISQALIMAIQAGGKASALAVELGSIETKRAALVAGLKTIEGQEKGKNERASIGDASQLLPVLQKMVSVFEEGSHPVPQQRAILSRFVRSITPRREGKHGPVMLEMVLGTRLPVAKRVGQAHPFEHRNSFLCSIWESGQCSLTIIDQ